MPSPFVVLCFQALASMSTAPFPELAHPEMQVESGHYHHHASPISASSASASPSHHAPLHPLPTVRESFSAGSAAAQAQQGAAREASTGGAGVQQPQASPARHHATSFNPFIYGNDVDTVDVATRIAMVNIGLHFFDHENNSFFHKSNFITHSFRA